VVGIIQTHKFNAWEHHKISANFSY
jgi:hypothetical protein